MGLLEDGERLGLGLAIGVGTIILAPAVMGLLAGVTKPIIKAGIKGGLLLAEKTKVMTAEAKEAIEDLTAEAKAELTQAHMATATAGAAAAPKGGKSGSAAKGTSSSSESK